MNTIFNKYSNIFNPRVLPNRVALKYPKQNRQNISFQTLSEQIATNYSNQPRIIPRLKAMYENAQSLPLYVNPPSTFNPFILYNTSLTTCTIQGVVTELGAPVVGKNIKVVLMTSDGDVVEKVWTDLEGNFIFYEIPQNLSLMAVAIDHSYKYNAVILSKILTVDNGVV